MVPILLVLLTGLIVPSMGLAQETQSADVLMTLGRSAYGQGAFTQALQYWTEAARRYERDVNLPGHIKAQVNLSQALYQIGHYREAGSILTGAGNRAAQIGDGFLIATIKGRLGVVLFALGENEEALKAIVEGLALARELNHAALSATLLNDKGNILSAEKNFPAAVAAYTESSKFAEASNLQTLAAIATINAARAEIQDGAIAAAKAKLERATHQLSSLPDSYDVETAWLTLGEVYEQIIRPRVAETTSNNEVRRPLIVAKRGRGAQVPSDGASSSDESTITEPSTEHAPAVGQSPPVGQSLRAPVSPAPMNGIDNEVLRHAAESYWNAIQIATRLKDSRSESYGWGSLGHVYEMLDRHDEALDLTRRAILAAQKVGSSESLYRWHWQTARLLRAKDQRQEAILAYQRAVGTLQPIRSEFLLGNRNRQFSFRETTGNLFFELADVLLQRASSTAEGPQRQHLLTQAQDTVELYKAAELQDYFKDECVATARSRSTDIAQEATSTAIVYPIVLPDRLELLVSLPAGLKQFIVPVPSSRLTDAIRSFRRALETRTNNSYLLHARKFYDWLIRPMEADLTAAGIKTLVFVPDGPLRTIPMAPLHDGDRFLIERYAIATTPGLTLTDARPLNRKQVHLFSMGLTEGVQGFPPLPYVAQELSAIQSIYGGKQLVNEEFRSLQVERGLKEEPYNIIHIASHGRVESDGTKSFILTFDDRITMDRLSSLVGLFDFRSAPLELLTLSACETAAGDDRAALGLAGVAIKAGAKSALATLWFIEDEATADLISAFYENLQNSAVSKAVALQQAQVALLKNPEHAHPSLWAPFLLINNWL
jgi:CHAT domain-containing protein/predicted negative regulator of RcsB-dependent stress response